MNEVPPEPERSIGQSLRLSGWDVAAPIAAALALRVGYVFWITRVLVLAVPPNGDAGYYYRIACSLAEGKGYGVTAHPMPLYPLALGAVFNVFGCSPLAARLLNVALAVCACWLVVRLGTQLDGRRSGLLAGWIYAAFPPLIAFSGEVLSENLGVPLLLYAVTEMVHAPAQSMRRAVLLGLAFGIAVLCRPEMVLLVLVGLSLPDRLFCPRAGSTGALARAACTVGVIACLLTPWVWRNYVVFGRFVPLTTNGGQALLWGNNEYAPADAWPIWNKLLPESHQMNTLREPDLDRLAMERAIAWVTRNPLRFVALVPHKVAGLWTLRTSYFFEGATEHVVIERWLPLLAHMLLLLGAVWGLLSMPVSRGRAVVIRVILMHVVLAGVFLTIPRYRMPLLAAFCAVAACGVMRPPSLSRRCAARVAILALSAVAFVATSWLEVIVEYVPRIGWWLWGID